MWGDKMILSKESKVSVVLPETPSEVEAFAASQLSYYLEKICGVSTEVCNHLSEGNINFVVGTLKAYAETGGLKAEKLGSEGFIIKIEDDKVFLLGSDDNDGCNRGTLYAVYEFLERFSGCCFGAFGAKETNVGEIVPSVEKLELNNTIYKRNAADLPYRTAIVQYGAWVGDADRKLTLPFIDWLAKNKYNRILTWVGVYNQFVELGLIPELKKRGIKLTVGHHQAISTFLPCAGNEYFPTEYGKKHTDFFRLRKEDGERVFPKTAGDFSGQWILCSRNEECMDELVKNILFWIDKNPIVDTIALWPNDGMSFQCGCEKCDKFSKQENYLWFLNEVAKRISAVKPSIKIDVLIYQDLWEIPEGISLCDSIVIDESTWAAAGLRTCGHPSGSGFIGTDMDKNLLSYRKAGSRTVLYDYYMGNYGNRQSVMPAADEMQSIFKYFKEKGHSGSGTQIECFNIWNNLLNFYCFARTAYDADISLEQNINAISRLFGEGADEISEIFKIYEDTLNGQVSIDKTGKFFIDNVPKEKVYDLFEAALSKAADKISRNNVKMLRMAFRYSDLSNNDPTEPAAQGNTTYTDPTGELGIMNSRFDSFKNKESRYAIAFPIDNENDADTDDKWFDFE